MPVLWYQLPTVDVPLPGFPNSPRPTPTTTHSVLSILNCLLLSRSVLSGALPITTEILRSRSNVTTDSQILRSDINSALSDVRLGLSLFSHCQQYYPLSSFHFFFFHFTCHTCFMYIQYIQGLCQPKLSTTEQYT
jgi:hypothetical protein